ncbi:SH3 domain-containing kinase-binding protein 1-like isoform X2 [Watersipora subatra]|uniref:SH3 domain-containing kinase-binding protein 1-like isoform X2 n=1 Tax=Watersipora subatra TaxID=2589382 RepID=UPI00355BC18C
MAKVKVIFDYDATQPDELTITVGEIIHDVIKQPGGWWEGSLNGKKGVFPDNFVEDYIEPKAPKTGGKVSDLQNRIGAQIKMAPPASKGGGKPKRMAVVLFDYKPEQPDELELKEDEEVEVVRMPEEGWWEGTLRGKTGMFPSNFVKILEPSSAPSGPAGPTPGSYTAQPAAAHNANDIGHRALGGRPPAEKPKMVPPPTESAAPPPQLPKRNRVKARVIFSYHAQNEDELNLQEGQVITVTDQNLEDPGWWKGELQGKSGVFPDNFVEVIPEEGPTQLPPGRVNKPPAQPPQEAERPDRLPPRPGPAMLPKNEDVSRGPGMPSPKVKPEPELHVSRGPGMPSPKVKPEPELHVSRGPGMPSPKVKPEPELPKPHATTLPQVAMVNGGDDKAIAQLREEIERMKINMVTRDSHEQLQQELRTCKMALENYKKESTKKMLDLMKEIDEGKKMNTQSTIELARIRRLAEDKW